MPEIEAAEALEIQSLLATSLAAVLHNGPKGQRQ